jgi:hypothetical protein
VAPDFPGVTLEAALDTPTVDGQTPIVSTAAPDRCHDSRRVESGGARGRPLATSTETPVHRMTAWSKHRPAGQFDPPSLLDVATEERAGNSPGAPRDPEILP